MEKLLHERLRDIEESDACTPEKLGYGENCGNTYCNKCEVDMFNALADEIERYYIPRPRFEDGEPVQFGDEVRAENTTYTVNEIAFSRDNWFLRQSQNQTLGGRLGSPAYRPAPKVLDADGVEINVGDTVYDTLNATDSNQPMTADRITDDIRIMCKYDGSKFGHYLATELTHERPVFDAEGVRICKGDTDCWTKDGRHVEVLQVGTYQGGKGCLVRSDKDIKFVVEGKDLTHLEPDSIARVVREIRENASNTDPGFIHTPDEYFIDRLTALIERGA